MARKPSPGRHPLRWLALLMAGCTGADATAPRVLGLEHGPAGPLVHAVSVQLDRPGPVEVEYWTPGAPPLRVRSAARERTHGLHLTRLRPGASYQFEVRGTGSHGSFTSDPLPPDLAALRFTATGASSLPLLLVHVSAPSGFRGHVVVDERGQVVWYARGTDFPFGMARRANGNFVFMDRVRGLREVTPAGEVLAELAQDLDAREMHHDVIATPDDSLLFLAFDRREWQGAPLKGEAIWEWWPESGRVEKRWSSWDHLSPETDRGPRFGVEWMHANALSIGPRGNVLVSVHYFDQVISIAPGWGGLEWRLGGVNATHALAPEDRFSGQHTAVEVAPGRVLLFDNGVGRGGPSRALELELAPGGARHAWSWQPAPPNYASAVSSARRLANGNTLVAFGMGEGLQGSFGGTEAYEVTPSGAAVWRLRVEGPSVMFRVEPLHSVGGEEAAAPSR